MAFLSCPPLPGARLSWHSVENFRNALVLPFHFLGGDRTDFRGGEVRCGWRERSLLVLAILQDDFVTTTATDDNQSLWALGDVLEIFLRDLTLPGYTELHAAPNGRRLQLRFPTLETIGEIRDGRMTFEPFKLEKPAFDFLVRTVDGGWQVLASIPWPTAGSLPGKEAAVSFSRYDYGSDLNKPVLSSTTAHAELNFHRQQDWTRIRFVESA